MPHDDPAATDPLTLHGVVVETEDGSAMREMAECFVEEYLRGGFDAQAVLQMFKTRGYAGPFLACQTLGEDVIRKIIDEQLALRNRHRATGCHAQAEDADRTGDTSLPVLNI